MHLFSQNDFSQNTLKKLNFFIFYFNLCWTKFREKKNMLKFQLPFTKINSFVDDQLCDIY